jgi:CheY-like chemotaxis protein
MESLMTNPYVLVVDDDPSTRMLVSDALMVFGQSSRRARNGQEALELIREEMPQAIILDLMMPEMTGFSFLATLTRELNGKTIPVIILSALGDQVKGVDALPGVVGMMSKGNFSMTGFAQLLTKAGLGTQPHTGPAASPVSTAIAS